MNTKANTDDRPARLLKAIPKHKSLTEAIKEAGYSESTANTQQGRTVENAINLTTERALQGNEEAAAALLAVGISKEEIKERYRYLALESENHNVSFQALKPLVTLTTGLQFTEQDQKPSAPPINIGIITNDKPDITAQQGDTTTISL